MPEHDKKFFIVGCFLAVFVAGLVIYAFAIGTMTPDQRTIMRILLSLVSGFLVGSFVGAFTVKAKGLIPGGVATATGGFGVWFLSAFLLLPPSKAFGVVVQPYGAGGEMDTLKAGTVTLKVGTDLRKEEIGQKGQAVFIGIPSELDGAAARVRVDAEGFTMTHPSQEVTLRGGETILVPMSKLP